LWAYIVAHWRGKLGLARSTSLNGVALYLALILGGVGVGALLRRTLGETRANEISNNPIAVYAVLAIYLILIGWASIGIVRCGVGFAMSKNAPLSRRVLGGLSALAAMAFVLAAIRDLRFF
jgi:hypothetical protein